MTALVIVLCGVVGLAVGSFLNVAIHRVPLKQSVVRPRSRCPGCGVEVKPKDNIPVASWLLLRRRCRSCRAPISGRYPLVELTTAALFVVMAVRFGADPALPAFLVLAAALVAVSAIDLEHFIVPNRIVYPALFMIVPLFVIAAAVDDAWSSLARAAIGGAIAWSALLVIHLISPRGMGFGDVRLAGLIGVPLGWLGLGHVPVGLFLGFASASVVGIALILCGRKGRKDKVPFGPFLASGAIGAILFGRVILKWYGV